MGMDRSERFSYWRLRERRAGILSTPPATFPAGCWGPNPGKGHSCQELWAEGPGKFPCAWPSRVVISGPWLPVELKMGRRNRDTDGAEWGMALYRAPYNWAAWRDLSDPGASYTLSIRRGPRLCKAGHPGYPQVPP